MSAKDSNDPRHGDQDAQALASMLQGYLAVAVQMADPDRLPILIRDVEIETDPQGDYRDHFTVVTKSGRRIQVRVRPE